LLIRPKVAVTAEKNEAKWVPEKLKSKKPEAEGTKDARIKCGVNLAVILLNLDV
jgi:hypothetical protein